MKALVVEDFKLISKMWVKVLRDIGYVDVEVSEHADEVLEAVTTFQPDLIFMDINLPGTLNGLELTEIIRKENQHTKIIVLSIHTEPSYIERAFQVGANGYLTKNSPVSEIKKAIETIMDGGSYRCQEITDTH